MASYLNTIGNFDPLSAFLTSMWFIEDISMSEYSSNLPNKYCKYYFTIDARIYINIQTKVISIEKSENWVLHTHTIWYKNVKHLMDTMLIYDNLFYGLEISNGWPLPF